MTSLDLKDTYFAIPVHHEHRKFLRFRWGTQSFQFNSLPFGLSTAPRVFTKVLRAIVGQLRSMGVRCVIYLDDILIMHQNKDVLVIDLLESLGFLVNFKKSAIHPCQEITFLGFVLDSMQKIRLPPEKVKQIQDEAHHLLNQKVSARMLAAFIGKLSAAIYPALLHALLQPTTSQTSSNQGLILRYTHKHLPSGTGGLTVVGSTPRQLERENNPDDDPRIGDRDGCVQDRLGSVLSRRVHRRVLVKGREDASHK